MKRCFTLLFLLMLSITSVSVYAGQFRLKVDDPTKVDLMVVNSFNFLYASTLTPGEWNDIEYGDEDVALVVRSLGGNGCYSVTKDGVAIQQNGSIYEVPLSEGCEIEVITEFPSESYPVKFEFIGCMEDCISSVEVNYKEVTDYLSPGFSVQAGSRLAITGNSKDYKLDNLKVNGEDVDYDLADTYTVLVTGPITFEFTAHRYRDFSVSINVNDPEGLTLLRDGSSTPISLKAGDNNVIFNEKNPKLTVMPNEGYKLTRFCSTEKDYLPDYDQYNTSIRVQEGMKLELATAPLEKVTHVVYFDDIEQLTQHDFVNSSWQTIDFVQGYNVYTMNEGENSFMFMPETTPAGVYLNGVRQESAYDTFCLYEITPKQNDVVKVFMLAEPKTHVVKFESAQDGGKYGISVVRDMIVPVEDLTAPLEVLGNTLVTIAPDNADSDLMVSANDEIVSPNAEGKYEIEVTGDTVVKYGKLSGIGLIDASNGEAAGKNVYNLQGILILSGADDAAISELPAGIYIINGEKRYIKH